MRSGHDLTSAPAFLLLLALALGACSEDGPAEPMPSADLSVTVTGDRDVEVGREFQVIVQVTNEGPDPAAGVVVSLELPQGVSTRTRTTGAVQEDGPVTWPRLSSVPAGGTRTFAASVQAGSAGTRTFRGRATSDTPDPDPSNNDGSGTGEALDVQFVDPPDPPPPPKGPAWLHVTHISLLPRITPPDSMDMVHSPDAGWPEVGQSVTWNAHVYNAGETVAVDVPFRWAIDEETVMEGTLEVPPGDTAVSLESAWPAHRQDITFSIHPSATTKSRPADIRSLTVRSDALSVTLWADSTAAAELAELPDAVPFAVVMGRDVVAWNEILDRYESDVGPGEVLDRLRLDSVAVLPPGASYPDRVFSDMAFYADSWFLSQGDRTVIFHELLHHRGVLDLYSYWVHHGYNGSEVLIREPDGSLAAGSERMPFLSYHSGTTLYLKSFPDRLMATAYERTASIDPLTAYGLNHVTGRRTPRWVDRFGNRIVGFAAGLQGGNEYLLDLPDAARVEIRTDEGPVPQGSTVEIFFDHARASYRNRHGPDPDLVQVADADGSVAFPLEGTRPPPDALIDTDVIIFRVTVGQEWGYAFLSEYDLNLAFLRGEQDTASLTLAVDPT